MCLNLMMIVCIKQHLSKFEAQFMKTLINTEAELKKALLIKKRVNPRRRKKIFYKVITMQQHLNENTQLRKIILIIMEI